MNSSSKSVVLLDANILYPAPVRDYFLQLASLELFQPKWTNEIQEEWIRNLLLNRTNLQRKDLEKARDAMNAAFPAANIGEYEELINSISLPDRNDRHVLAAAIKANADKIVTFNSKDFPALYLRTLTIEVQHPDAFIIEMINLDKAKAIKALNNQVKNLKNPPKSKDEVLEILKRCWLKNTVAAMQK